jgi:fructosamine-3-kinase
MTLLIGSLGQFNYERWRKRWAELFASHRLVHNIHNTRKIIVSKEVDGAFAVFDLDTWKMTGHTGLLDYSQIKN